jgi:hypothetical protein
LTGLARLFVWHADCGDFEHTRALGNDVFDFVRIDVEAGYENHVLLAIDDVEVASFIHLRDVAGMQPAIGAENLRCLSGPLPVALHDLRTLQAQLADLADAQRVAIVVLDRGVGR